MTTHHTLGAPQWSEHALDRLRERYGVDEAGADAWLLDTLREVRTIHYRKRPYDARPGRLWVTLDTVIVSVGNEIITVYRVTPLQRDCLLYEMSGAEDEGQGAA